MANRNGRGKFVNVDRCSDKCHSFADAVSLSRFEYCLFNKCWVVWFSSVRPCGIVAHAHAHAVAVGGLYCEASVVLNIFISSQSIA